ncbi:hypothetical protein ANN_27108 [Periplaneta americana]|uniref:DUF4817 domain-containing protein n=1 Tax=Periplaneta americana TaxID=6978 RepID=A0ABQ8RX80_PERAM|nr:hypothetical protein ANN_27108 [Periplaneta americana]
MAARFDVLDGIEDEMMYRIGVIVERNLQGNIVKLAYYFKGNIKNGLTNSGEQFCPQMSPDSASDSKMEEKECGGLEKVLYRIDQACQKSDSKCAIHRHFASPRYERAKRAPAIIHRKSALRMSMNTDLNVQLCMKDDDRNWNYNITECEQQFFSQFPDYITMKYFRRNVINLVDKFRATECTERKKSVIGPTKVTEDDVEDARERMHRGPNKSVKKLAVEIGISYGSVHKILRNELVLQSDLVFNSCSSNKHEASVRIHSKFPNRFECAVECHLLRNVCYVVMPITVDGIRDSETVFGEMRSRIRHRLHVIRLTFGMAKPNPIPDIKQRVKTLEGQVRLLLPLIEEVRAVKERMESRALHGLEASKEEEKLGRSNDLKELQGRMMLKETELRQTQAELEKLKEKSEREKAELRQKYEGEHQLRLQQAEEKVELRQKYEGEHQLRLQQEKTIKIVHYNMCPEMLYFRVMAFTTLKFTGTFSFRRSLPSKETLRGHSDSSFRGEGYIQCCVGVRLCDMYSNQELAEIHFMYGKADGNAALARRLYQERYPQRQCPDRKTFVRLHYRLCEYEKFNSPGLGRGRPRSTTIEVQEEILEAENMTPSISTRRVALQVNIPHTTVWRLLKEYQLYPYHLQRVQALSPADYPARVRFCQWFLQQCGVNPNFPALVLFTDEAQFTRDSTISMYGRMKTHVQLFHLITRCGTPSRRYHW